MLQLAVQIAYVCDGQMRERRMFESDVKKCGRKQQQQQQ